jgi:hypothetical protein
MFFIRDIYSVVIIRPAVFGSYPIRRLVASLSSEDNESISFFVISTGNSSSNLTLSSGAILLIISFALPFLNEANNFCCTVVSSISKIDKAFSFERNLKTITWFSLEKS